MFRYEKHGILFFPFAYNGCLSVDCHIEVSLCNRRAPTSIIASVIASAIGQSVIAIKKPSLQKQGRLYGEEF